MCFPKSELGSPVPWKNFVPSSFFLCHAPALILQSLLLGAGDEHLRDLLLFPAGRPWKT